MRTVALSNLSLLPGSLVRGPQWTWKIAREAGFDALKLNPLRGWEARNIDFPVSAFEAPWRTSFGESIKNLWLRRDVVGFIADVFFFGYRGAQSRSQEYGLLLSDVVGIDCPASYGYHFVRARETECLPEKWMDPLHAEDSACLDLWHIRGYSPEYAIIEELARANRIRTIDVQTRDYPEMLQFLQGKPTKLGRQLRFLRGQLLPGTVSVSAELLPQHLWKLRGELGLHQAEVLRLLQERIRESLP